MQSISLREIAKALNCKTVSECLITEVVTDSRNLGPRSLFVAIIGDNFDGNDFVKDALKNGAPFAIVSRIAEGVDPKRVLLVPDTKKAHVIIGGLYRRRFDLPIVGVTGSVGKTTTKEFIHVVLSAKYTTHKNEGNQNNEVGVPQTLFALLPQHQAAVVEMGMNGLGEISDLTAAVRPVVGVITCIGVSHMEALGSRENILKAKLELLEGLPNGAPLFLWGDDDLLNTVHDQRFRIYRYGILNPDCHIRALNISSGNGQTSFDIASVWGNFHAMIPTVGQHNVTNALAAFGVGCVMGIDPRLACDSLKNYAPAGMRQKFVEFNGFTVVEDCYNSSPDSLRAAASALLEYPCNGRRILALSDMLELGTEEKAIHAQCGEFISNSKVDILCGCGSLTKELLAGAVNIKTRKLLDNKEALADYLTEQCQPGDVVWFKASRGMKLEECISRMYENGRKSE